MAPRPRIAAALLLAAAALLPGNGAAARERPRPERVILFGIDGADAEVFEDLRARGLLPHMDALAKEGSYARLATTNPAQSPVAWAAATTGSNPGKTGIFDFLFRDPDAPGRIDIALVTRGRADGPLGEGARVALVALGAIAAALLGAGIPLLLLRSRPGLAPRRRWSAAAATGLLLGGAAGLYVHRVLEWIPRRVPAATSNRLGNPLWSVLGAAGIPSVAVEAPLAFPADRAANLHLLAGLGVPDLQATWGLYSVFTTDGKDVVSPETGGFVDALSFDGSGVARSRVYGPEDITLGKEETGTIDRQAALARNLWEDRPGVPSTKRREERRWQHARRARQASCVLEIRRDPAAGTATVRVGSGGPRPVLDLPVPAGEDGATVGLPAPEDGSVRWGEPVVLRERAWSAHVPFEFVLNPLVRIRGIGKFWLESAGGNGTEFRLVLTPISMDPRAVPPAAEVSHPREFAPSLAAKAGVYDLLGWPCLTNPVKDGMLSDEAFLAHAREILAERKRKLRAAMETPGWRFLFVMFSEVDRVQHAFWRHRDPLSKLHDREAAKIYAPAIEEFYVAMDGVLGDLRKSAGPGTAIVVMSDHGFAPFRRSVHLNNWLAESGFLKGGFGADRAVGEIFAGRNFLQDLDWAGTKAYALGLGGIYLNLRGREAKGSVAPEDADAVMAKIREGLLALRDADGARVVREVYRGKDIYRGPAAARLAPDLVVGFERGYRVSWQTTLGGGGAAVIVDNEHRWSGDHCSVDPSLVPGILVSSVPLRAEGASVLDVAPTILDLFGVPVPGEWDGKSLLPK